MPELPEVEHAVRQLRAAVVGRRIAAVDVRHPSLARRLAPSAAHSLVGARIARVDRRGKHQLLVLDDGRMVHAHFRMTGDWVVQRAEQELPRFARAVIAFDDGTRLVLEDSRALATLDVHAAGTGPVIELGPEPADEALTVDYLRAQLARRRGAIKPALLDQRVIAGLGNIYVAEALWRAKVSPRARASSLSAARLATLIAAIRAVIARATGARYRD
ncbi:MAG TPA: DNA-formamidopyrimidine glycosylase family protein, partial [Gemmatimonadaceae bacterium]|nr:DNA-formamidopyrimidine glycosylase family protein [Gemmatimonadaceae bacterium]